MSQIVSRTDTDSKVLHLEHHQLRERNENSSLATLKKLKLLKIVKTSKLKIINYPSKTKYDANLYYLLEMKTTNDFCVFYDTTVLLKLDKKIPIFIKIKLKLNYLETIEFIFP